MAAVSAHMMNSRTLALQVNDLQTSSESGSSPMQKYLIFSWYAWGSYDLQRGISFVRGKETLRRNYLHP